MTILNLFTGGWGSIVTSILSALASAFNGAVTDVFKAVEGSMIATTTPHLRHSTWFGQVFHAVMVPAFVISMVVLMCAIAEAVLRGEPHEVVRRAFVAPVAVGVAMAAATTIGGAAVGAVNTLSKGVLDASLAHNAATVGLGAIVTAITTTSIDPLITIVLALVAIVALVCVWIEMVLRGVLIYLVFAMVPLAVAGVFWRQTQSWLRRVIDITVALLLTQLIIFTVFAIGIDAVSHLTTGWSAAPLAIGTLVIAAFSLPIALRLAPHTTAAAANFGRSIAHVKQATQTAAGTAGAAATGGTGALAGAGAAGAGGFGAAGASSGGVVDGAGFGAQASSMGTATPVTTAMGASAAGDSAAGDSAPDAWGPFAAPGAESPTPGPTPTPGDPTGGALPAPDGAEAPQPTGGVEGDASGGATVPGAAEGDAAVPDGGYTPVVGPVPGTHAATMRANTAARQAPMNPPDARTRRRAAIAHAVDTMAKTGHAPSAVAAGVTHFVTSHPAGRKATPRPLDATTQTTEDARGPQGPPRASQPTKETA